MYHMVGARTWSAHGGQWTTVFAGDERLTAALLDRLAHRCHVLEFRDSSYRFRDSLAAREFWVGRDVSRCVATLAGRGTSDQASVYAQYIFGTRNDLRVALRWDDNQGLPEQYTPTYTLALVRHHCRGVGSRCGEPILDRDSAPGPEPADLVRVCPRPAHPGGRGLPPGCGP
jgi:hypothetical protein